jgi:serine/threonine-protein kinase
VSVAPEQVWLLDDRYEVGEVIGRGGMGEVRQARDRRLARDVAIKFLRSDLAAQPDAHARFAEEARNAGRLSHPNVVLVLDQGEHDGRPYLVMERLPGETLHDEIGRGPLTDARACAVARDVLSGVGAAHALGIVHRDVTPANVLLTEDGRAKVADFGIAKTTDSASFTVVGQVLGTPAYLAPERLHGEPATAASDVYAVGVVLYEALTGERPFAGDTPVAVAAAVTEGQVVPMLVRMPNVDTTLAAAIDAAMQRDPSKRPTAEQMLAMISDSASATVAIAAAGPPPTVTVPLTPEDTIALTVTDQAAPATVAASAAALAGAPQRRPMDPRRRTALIAAATVVGIAVLLLVLANTDSPPGVSTSESPGTSAPAATAPAVAPTTAVARAPLTTARQPLVNVRLGNGGDGKGRHKRGKH